MEAPLVVEFVHRDSTEFAPRLPLAREHTPQPNRPDSRPRRILLIDGERTIARTMSVALEADGHEAVSVESSSGALRQMRKSPFDVAFLDLRPGSEDGLDVLARLRCTAPALAVVVMSASACIPTAMEAARRGAVDYLPKPFTPEQLRQVLGRIEQSRGLERRVEEPASLFGAAPATRGLAPQDPAMRDVLDLAHQTAASHASIMLLGESGTGKSVLAREIHQHSLRAGRPFVTVSCPSLSRDLLESELFGHARGAFTGAVTETLGKVAAANGGTLFLDEIGELPLEIQPKLLRLLQEREYERVGETQTRRADVRIVSSTNRDLALAIREGKFRADLYYRLNVVALHLPPLRERPRDLEQLAATHLRLCAEQNGKTIHDFSPEAKSLLRRYLWPGNLRELRNAIERAVVLSTGSQIEAAHLSPLIAGPARRGGLDVGADTTLENLADEHIRQVLARTSRLSEAASILGIDLATLYRRRRKWQTDATLDAKRPSQRAVNYSRITAPDFSNISPFVNPC